MPTSYRAILTAALLAAAVSSCSWIDLKPGAADVELVTQSQAAGCQRLGNTTVSVRDSVASIERSSSKVADELARLARNSAVDMKGDTIVAQSQIHDGEQSFGVYRCVSR